MLDPELGASIVELGMVGEITVFERHAVVHASLTTVGCPLRSQIERDVKEAALTLEDVDTIDLVMGVLDAPAKAALMKRARTIAQASAPSTSIPTHTPVLMIASGKGGVGKSSITANLAVALAATGRCVGVLDADIWGFSLSRLLGIHGDIEASGGKMQPLERSVGAGSIKLLSMGLLADEDQALMWRGLMVQKAVAQFIEDADWSGIDYFLIMSGFICTCGERHDVFGQGGGRSLSEELHVPLLAEIELNAAIGEGGDHGEPVVMAESDEGVFHRLARRILDDVAPPFGAVGCSARMLDSLSKAVANVRQSS